MPAINSAVPEFSYIIDLRGIPLEFFLHGLCHAPALSNKAKLGEYRACSNLAKVLNQILPQNSNGHGIEQKCTLPGKTDHAPPSGSNRKSSLWFKSSTCISNTNQNDAPAIQFG